MSSALERLGRFAARRPWVVIGSWVAIGVLVIDLRGSLRTRPRRPVRGTRDWTRTGPPSCSPQAGSDEVGLGADVVLTPRDPETSFFDSPAARADVARIQEAVRRCRRCSARPSGRPRSGRPAGCGRVRSRLARRRGRPDPRPVPRARSTWSPPTWRTSRRPSPTSRESSTLRIEAGGDLYFAFEEPPTGLGEALGLVVAMVILLLAFGSVVAMGLPIGTALLGLAVGAGSLSLVAYLVDIPAAGRP